MEIQPSDVRQDIDRMDKIVEAIHDIVVRPGID